MDTGKTKLVGSSRWSVPSSSMKTPTRPGLTMGGMHVGSSSKTNMSGTTGARFSIGGAVPASARRHSVFRSIMGNLKDTRPLSSKDYQNEMVRNIYEFLLEHDGENCIPESVIRSPTKRDFVYMFESIYQHLSPDFEIKNMLEEVPAIFRGLGYPTAIKPSTLQTIGASHSWPTLLGALTWLIDVVVVKNSVQGQAGQNLLLGGDDSDGALKAYKYSWLNAGFREYQGNRKAIDNLGFFDDKIKALRVWSEQQEDFDAQQDVIRATLEHIREECAELEANKGNLEALREDISRLADDITKAANYKEQTEQDINHLMGDYNAVKTQVEAETKMVNELNSKVIEVQGLIKAQEESNGLCSSEARELMAEIDQNKLTITKLKNEVEVLSKQHWLAVPKIKNAFVEQDDRYHKMILNIKNLHSIAHCGDELVIDDHAKDERSLYDAVSNVKTLNEVIKAAFLQRKWDLTQRIRQFASELETVKQEFNMISGKVREEQRAELRGDRQRKRDRDEWNKELVSAEADLDRLENEKEVLEDKRHEISSLKREIDNQKAANLEHSEFLGRKQCQIRDAVLSRFHLIVRDLDLMNEAREWMMRTMKDFCDLVSHTDEGFVEH